MSKRLWTGLLVGVIGAMALIAVGVGAFHAGERHTVTTVAPVADAATGEAVRVVGYGHWGPWGGPPFGFLFPLLIIGLDRRCLSLAAAAPTGAGSLGRRHRRVGRRAVRARRPGRGNGRLAPAGARRGRHANDSRRHAITRRLGALPRQCLTATGCA